MSGGGGMGPAAFAGGGLDKHTRLGCLALPCLAALPQAAQPAKCARANCASSSQRWQRPTCPPSAGFRRHNCKHIMLVLSQLGIEEAPQEVRAGRVGTLAAECGHPARAQQTPEPCRLPIKLLAGLRLLCALLHAQALAPS